VFIKQILSLSTLEWLDLDHHPRIGAAVYGGVLVEPFMPPDGAKRNGRLRRTARTPASGRPLEVTNGSFTDAKRKHARAERWSAMEKHDGRVWVGI